MIIDHWEREEFAFNMIGILRNNTGWCMGLGSRPAARSRSYRLGISLGGLAASDRETRLPHRSFVWGL